MGRTQEPLEAIAAIPDEPQPQASRPPTPPAPAAAPTPLRTLKAQWGGLTAREREVAALVAQGKSNRQIAEDLVVSERTVDAHVGNILSKLEFTSRTQIATWAINKGLVQTGGELTSGKFAYPGANNLGISPNDWVSPPG